MSGQSLRGAISPDVPVVIPLWSKLPRGERYRYISQFMHLNPGALPSLGAVEFGLLMQWVFEQRGLETTAVVYERGRLDLELYNARHARSEFARAYAREQDMPAGVLGVLLNDLKGTRFQRIYLCTTGTFSQRFKPIQFAFPLALNLVEGEELRSYVRTAQQKWRQEMDRRRSRTAYVLPERKGVWRLIKRKVLGLFRKRR